MPLYNETSTTETVKTTTYDRAYRTTVHNPNNGTPKIVYEEERIKRLNDNAETDKSVGVVGKLEKELTLANSSTSFPLLNPADGTSLGATATYADVQVLLYSLYFYLAKDRDNA